MCKVNGNSPWGSIQHITDVVPGIVFVSTAGHGGIHLDRAHQAKMPDYMKAASWAGGPYYEEDVDWCMPYCVFEAEIREHSNERETKVLDDGSHLSTLRNWKPEVYEKFYGVTLAPGESHMRDEQVWKKEHAGHIQAVSAFGDWQAGVPKGMVGVVACVGGRADNGRYADVERYFLVPKAEYDTRGRYSFIVDPNKHIECGDFTKLRVMTEEDVANV